MADRELNIEIEQAKLESGNVVLIWLGGILM